MDLQRPRRIVLVGLLAACLLVVVSSGAFSSTEADRNVTVNVANEEDAYMSLDYSGGGDVEEGDTESVLTVTNLFMESVEVSLETESSAEGNATKPIVNTPASSIDSGGSTSLEAEFGCKPGGTGNNHLATVTVTNVTFTGDNVSASTEEERTVEFDVDCNSE